MMNLVTNRSVSDAMLRSSGGLYTVEDLNRVESAVKYLAFVAKDFLAYAFDPQTKTDWSEPGLFSVSTWNVASQMDRYLTNVKRLCKHIGVQAQLPESMRFLTVEGANQIEKALELVRDEVSKNFKGYKYSGEVYAGEENGL